MRHTTTKCTKLSTSLRFIDAQLRHICFADWSFARKLASAIGAPSVSTLFHSIGIRLAIRCFVFWIVHDLAVRSPVAVVEQNSMLYDSFVVGAWFESAVVL